MIRVYEATEKSFNHNGIKTIKPRKAVVFEEKNGDYYADIECSIEYAEWMKQDNIVICGKNKQAFRLNNPVVRNNVMIFKSWHISYDSKNYIIESLSKTGGTCKEYLSSIVTVPVTKPFVFDSDITDTLTLSYKYLSLYDVIMGLVESFEGVLIRDNWNIKINTSNEIDKEKVIAMGKNINTYESKEIWDNVVTRLLPVGYNDLTIGYFESNVTYDIPYTKVVKFNPSDSVDTENPIQLENDLRQQANAYITKNAYPEVCYTIESTLDDAVVGEIIKLKHPRLNKELTTNVYATEFDVLKNKVTKITFGTFYDSTKRLIRTKVTDKIQQVSSDLEVLDKTAKASIKVNADNIELRVEKDQVIAAINLTSEEAKILAKRIKLEGYTTINEGFIVTESGNVEINGGKFKSTGSDGSIVLLFDGFIGLGSSNGEYNTQMASGSVSTIRLYCSTLNGATPITSNNISNYISSGNYATYAEVIDIASQLISHHESAYHSG